MTIRESGVHLNLTEIGYIADSIAHYRLYTDIGYSRFDIVVPAG